MMSGAAIANPRPISGMPEVVMMNHKISTGARGHRDPALVLSLKINPPKSVDEAWGVFSARTCRMNF